MWLFPELLNLSKSLASENVARSFRQIGRLPGIIKKYREAWAREGFEFPNSQIFKRWRGHTHHLHDVIPSLGPIVGDRGTPRKLIHADAFARTSIAVVGMSMVMNDSIRLYCGGEDPRRTKRASEWLRAIEAWACIPLFKLYLLWIDASFKAAIEGQRTRAMFYDHVNPAEEPIWEKLGFYLNASRQADVEKNPHLVLSALGLDRCEIALFRRIRPNPAPIFWKSWSQWSMSSRLVEAKRRAERRDALIRKHGKVLSV
jgi:hypothetical protein